ncbi:MAG: thiol:disulfide interchange protein DsbC [Oleiphilaceae bacterium]|jgi:thiol:disulfide interchange protein DsbC
MTKAALTILGIVMSASLSATSIDLSQEAKTNIATKLEAITGFTVKSVTPHDIGLIEVITEKGIFYSTPDGSYLINGQVHVFEDGLYNLTAQAKSDVAKTDIEDMKSSFVTFKADNQKHELVVFFDTDCGYCRKMHNEMSQYNAMGITIHYAMWPRQGVYVPQSNGQVYTQGFLNMQSIVCAPNPEMAMNMVMRDSVIPKSSCDNKIEESYALGHWLGVQGTPAVYDLEGKQVTRGYLPPAKLIKVLEG